MIFLLENIIAAARVNYFFVTRCAGNKQNVFKFGYPVGVTFRFQQEFAWPVIWVWLKYSYPLTFWNSFCTHLTRSFGGCVYGAICYFRPGVERYFKPGWNDFSWKITERLRVSGNFPWSLNFPGNFTDPVKTRPTRYPVLKTTYP